jgi:hypothetical protein
MAKPKTKEDDNQLSMNLGSNTLPTESSSFADQHAGAGLSTAPEDNLVPLLYVLQTNSPQVNKRDPKYIEGAEPGDIWLRNAPIPIIKGEQGIMFQPCHFYKDWGEWIDRDEGGGLVGRHRDLPKDAKEYVDPTAPGVPKYKSAMGNELVETRNFAGYVMTPDGPLAYLIPLKGSGHSVGKQWMTSMNLKKTASGRKAPIWSFAYLLKTVQRKNKKGEWFVLDIQGGSAIVKEVDQRRGYDLEQAFAEGKKVAEEEDTTVTGSVKSDVM